MKRKPNFRSGTNKLLLYGGVSLLVISLIALSLSWMDTSRGSASTNQNDSNNNKNVVIELTDSNFHASIGIGLWLIEFYNPACSFCIEFEVRMDLHSL